MRSMTTWIGDWHRPVRAGDRSGPDVLALGHGSIADNRRAVEPAVSESATTKLIAVVAKPYASTLRVFRLLAWDRIWRWTGIGNFFSQCGKMGAHPGCHRPGDFSGEWVLHRESNLQKRDELT